MNNLISVIIPVYNAEKYVRNAIDSVLAQTYKNIEIIIVDDGSTDGSATICKEYERDLRVKYFYQENKGLSASRQLGIDLCGGDYFATIDADDYIAVDYIEKMYSAIRAGGDVCVCEWVDFCDENSNRRNRSLRVSYEFLNVTVDMLRKNYRKIGGDLTLSDSWNKLYRTDFVRQSGVRFELAKKYNGNDLAFNYKLLLHCPKYCIVKNKLLFHRIVDGSMVHKKKKKLQDGFNYITDQVMQEMDKVGVIAPSQVSLFYYRLACLVFWDELEFSQSMQEFVNDFNVFSQKHYRYVLDRHIVNVEDYSLFSKYDKFVILCLENHLKIGLLTLASLIRLKRNFLGRKK